MILKVEVITDAHVLEALYLPLEKLKRQIIICDLDSLMEGSEVVFKSQFDAVEIEQYKESFRPKNIDSIEFDRFVDKLKKGANNSDSTVFPEAIVTRILKEHQSDPKLLELKKYLIDNCNSNFIADMMGVLQLVGDKVELSVTNSEYLTLVLYAYKESIGVENGNKHRLMLKTIHMFLKEIVKDGVEGYDESHLTIMNGVFEFVPLLE